MSAPEPVGPVVTGFDGSPSAEDALVLARAWARVLGTGLVVATVHPSPAPISSGRVDAEWVADRHHEAEKVLEGAHGLLAAVDAVDYRVVASSSAAHGLHDLAEELGASVIVVGSSSAAAERRLFAGSTADRLLAGSQAPVGVAPAGFRDRNISVLERIGVAFVDTPDGHAALDLAVRLAVRVSATLTLYSVLAGEAELVMPVIGRDAEHAFAATAQDRFQRALDLALAGIPAGVPAGARILTGNVVDVLAELDEVDVLFCGSRGYGPARRVLLGGVSSRLVRRARSPIVVVPRG
ncbi:universal stress protein [Petropleomorpha daqingensis]|uniref:Nucleotide-binding universal stress UspA family protein n=1 Tax=Petropleomorpha daqingensis TaxID=2026353 RepID=A0A853CLH4_9ACTN|nr:universal stress protein [Petropleomorpha daqingensis]NYJ08924.1 nucleotide-binding universal stress UspA family protein [Petropleomorpha daqingensis]